MQYNIKKEWLNITIDKKTTLKEFFDFYHISKKNRYLILQNEDIYLNHLPLKNESELLSIDQQLRLKVFKKEAIDYIPENLFPLDVVYEDAFCLIVNKPAGYIVHDEHNSLANVVAYYYKQHKINAPIRYIHRLDKETNGLVFFCKCSFFQSYFDELLSKKQITRKYIARIDGCFPYSTYTCSLPIAKDRHNNNKYIAHKNGKPAITHFEKINDNTVRCILETGRTHQIRVHLSSLGYSIVNDAIYGKVTSEEDMALCAYELTWPHPITHELLTCSLFDINNQTPYIDI